MGYTHYYNNGFEITDKEWEEVELAITPILNQYKNIICADYENSEESFIINHDEIIFNGKGDEGHETFAFYKKPKHRGFAFCKTARKPYDIVVCKVLLVLFVLFGNKLDLGSDGFPDDENWGEALSWVNQEYKCNIQIEEDGIKKIGSKSCEECKNKIRCQLETINVK